jgi:hypothetical protein
VSAETAAARGRRLIESMMRSTCTVRELSSSSAVDPDSGQVTPVPGAIVYSGKCRVRPLGNQSQTQDAGGAEVFSFDYLVSLPFNSGGSADVREGMTCHIDSSPDPALAGVDVEVQKVDRGDDITARRLFCNEVV